MTGALWPWSVAKGHKRKGTPDLWEPELPGVPPLMLPHNSSPGM